MELTFHSVPGAFDPEFSVQEQPEFATPLSPEEIRMVTPIPARIEASVSN